jgi:uracil-DNA glycosylase family 4
MISIKNSFVSCSECLLLEHPSCIFETNCKDDISKVDVIFILDYPNKIEVKKNQIFKSHHGKLFRKYFEKYEINKMNYLLTYSILCYPLNSHILTENYDHIVNLCKHNCINIIKACNPKLIVTMGNKVTKALNISNSEITNIHGQIFNWKNNKVLTIVHPSFINNQVQIWEPEFEESIKQIPSIINNKDILKNKNIKNIKNIKKGLFRYKIPDKYYTDNYRLIDIQYLTKTQKILYIFRDKENNKIFHQENDDYICYQLPDNIPAKKILPADQLYQIKIKYRDRYNLDSKITYEGDIKLTTKHAMDYYYYNKGEAKKTDSNIIFFDIEIDTGKDKIFPNPKEAKYPINMLTTIYNSIKTCYVVDNKTEPVKKRNDVTYKIFKTELELLKTFIIDFKKMNGDYLTGWNCISFDLEYIYNRLPKLNIQSSTLSLFNEFYIDSDRYICNISGIVVLDQYYLYRLFTFTKMENYTLGFISQEELGISKINLPLPFNEMYWKMLNLTIDYNIRDVELLEKLENKLNHINLINELRIICTTSFDYISSLGQTDSILLSYLKNKKLIAKNADRHIKKEKYAGAFVFEPTPGIYDYITDFDYTSLYPSIIITYNIGINSYVMKTVDPDIGYDILYNKENLPNKIELIVDPLYKKKNIELTPSELFKLIDDKKLILTINGCFFVSHEKEFSIFGEIVDMLMKSRKKYKNKMFDAIENKNIDEEKFYYTRQLVYKVLANTLYGVIANNSFRFFDVSLASAITLSGQEALKTSIIEGDAYVRHLQSNEPYITPPQLTKDEMYGDVMPNRSNEYIITGDTDSIFICFQTFKDTSITNIQLNCKKIETFLNDIKMIEMIKKHNVLEKYNRLILKNELIISRGIFLAKKRYAIRVINNEGKTVDKINYMGLEIKRSDYPKQSKIFLSKLIKLILKPEKFSITKITKFINEQEKYFRRLIIQGDKSVARPVSFGKNIEDYKVIPQGVRAMIAWNKLMYHIHDKGCKSYMYWVKGIDFEKISDIKEREKIQKQYEKYIKEGNKLEVISIPDEEIKLPDWFIPDVKSAIKFCFTDRHELLMKPIASIKKNTLLTI